MRNIRWRRCPDTLRPSTNYALKAFSSASSSGILPTFELRKVSFTVKIKKKKNVQLNNRHRNFAFLTAYTRVGGNKKGIFTRDRQPKMVAHHVRRRYHALSAALDDQPEVPNDLDNYVSSYFAKKYTEIAGYN